MLPTDIMPGFRVVILFAGMIWQQAENRRLS
jgi:hypothetical protein